MAIMMLDHLRVVPARLQFMSVLSDLSAAGDLLLPQILANLHENKCVVIALIYVFVSLSKKGLVPMLKNDWEDLKQNLKYTLSHA